MRQASGGAARKVHHLTALARELEALGIDLLVLDQAIVTSTPAGQLLFNVLPSIAEFERGLIREQTVAERGLRSAGARESDAPRRRSIAWHSPRASGPAPRSPNSPGAFGSPSRPSTSSYRRRWRRGSLPEAYAWKGSRTLGRPCKPAGLTRGPIRPTEAWQQREGFCHSRPALRDAREPSLGLLGKGPRPVCQGCSVRALRYEGGPFRWKKHPRRDTSFARQPLPKWGGSASLVAHLR